MARTPKVVEDRREQIVNAAMRVFAQKGFSRATNKDIAREAGITSGLIYHYFESKEALLQTIIDERSPVKLIRDLPPEVWNLPPESFVPLVVRRILTLIESEHFVQLIRVVLPELIHNPTFTPLAHDALHRTIIHLERYVQRKIDKGEIVAGDARLYAQMVVGNIMGMVLRRHIFRDPWLLDYSQEQIATTLINVILHGLLPSKVSGSRI